VDEGLCDRAADLGELLERQQFAEQIKLDLTTVLAFEGKTTF